MLILEFNAQSFVKAFAALTATEHILNAASQNMREQFVRPETARGVLRGIETVGTDCMKMQLLRSIDQAKRIKDKLRAGTCTNGELRQSCIELRNRMHDELNDRVFFTIRETEAHYYRDNCPFGVKVADVFSTALTDMQEASRCLALDRNTACVFHLMRVVEHGVQHFGKRFKITFTDVKVWQTILDQINLAIKAMPNRTGAQKKRQSESAAVTAHLFNVKLAWRNPVMHPKATYTATEAQDIFKHVDTFMRHLADIVR